MAFAIAPSRLPVSASANACAGVGQPRPWRPSTRRAEYWRSKVVPLAATEPLARARPEFIAAPTNVVRTVPSTTFSAVWSSRSPRGLRGGSASAWLREQGSAITQRRIAACSGVLHGGGLPWRRISCPPSPRLPAPPNMYLAISSITPWPTGSRRSRRRARHFRDRRPATGRYSVHQAGRWCRCRRRCRPAAPCPRRRRRRVTMASNLPDQADCRPPCRLSRRRS